MRLGRDNEDLGASATVIDGAAGVPVHVHEGIVEGFHMKPQGLVGIMPCGATVGVFVRTQKYQ